MTNEQTYTPKDLAEELGVTPKDFRRWLRTQTDDRAGRGGSWNFSEEMKDILLEMYRAKPARGQAVSPTLKSTAQDDDEAEFTDELDDVDTEDLEV